MPRHPFHIVDMSPWPLVVGVNGLSLAMGLVGWFHGGGWGFLGFGLLVLILALMGWWRDVVRESTYLGCHTSYVSRGLRGGMVLFLLSEVMFFFGFFWTFFHSALSPVPEIGCVWPPIGVDVIGAFSVPLVNTAILLGSGVSITWAHHSLVENSYRDMLVGLGVTVGLGGLFTLLQVEEYAEASFSISDGVYGSIFFVATGFHGLHVMIGTSFLVVCLVRMAKVHYSLDHHLGFEFGAWYWHFVDVVWIFLYLCLYWWGG